MEEIIKKLNIACDKVTKKKIEQCNDEMHTFCNKLLNWYGYHFLMVALKNEMNKIEEFDKTIKHFFD